MLGRCGIQFGLLGPLSVITDDGAVDIRSDRQRTLLAVLLLDCGRPVSVDRLIEAIWEDGIPRTARNALQVHVSNLRSLLGRQLIEMTTAGYRMNLPEDAVDTEQFRSLADRGKRALANGADLDGIESLQSALDLWRGPALADFVFTSWAQHEIHSLQQERIDASIALLEARLQRGEKGLPVEIERLVTEDPYRESLRALHARALYQDNRRAAALRSLDSTRRALADEIGLDLSPELQALEQHILDQNPELERTRSRHRIPSIDTSFVGRTTEMEKVASMLEERRLVTIVGPPGVGKSRLALEVAQGLSGAVRWIDLTGIERGSFIDDHVLQAAGLNEEPLLSPRESLVVGIGGRPMTLILDRVEHIREAAADLLAVLRARCPALRVLITSREPIGLTAECVVGIEPLKVVNGDISPATQLFVDRVQTADPSRGLDPSEPVVVDICRKLDGLPLALELAAARVADMELDGVREDVVLRSKSRGPMGALESTIHWSFGMLSSPVQTVLTRLSVFVAPFDIKAARRVGSTGDVDEGDILDYLTLLVNKSLLAVESGSFGRRYRLLDTIRSFARSRLDPDELAAVSRRHADHFLHVAIDAGPGIRGGPSQIDLVNRLEGDLPNLMAGLEWASDSGDPLLVEAAVSMLPFWLATSRSQNGLELSRVALASAGSASPDLVIRAMTARAVVTSLAENQAEAESIAREALALARRVRPDLEYEPFFAMAYANFNSRDPAMAVEFGMRAGRLAEDVGDLWIAGWAWMTAGTAQYEIGKAEDGMDSLRHALDLLTELDDSYGMAWTHWCLAVAARIARRLEDHEEQMEDAYSMFSRINHSFGISNSLWGLGEAAWISGESEKAKDLYLRALEISDDLGIAGNVIAVNARLAMIDLSDGHADAAMRRLQDVTHLATPKTYWAVIEICLPLAIWALESGWVGDAAPLVFAARRHSDNRGLAGEPDMALRWDDAIDRIITVLGGGVGAAQEEASRLSEEDVIDRLKELIDLAVG